MASLVGNSIVPISANGVPFTLPDPDAVLALRTHYVYARAFSLLIPVDLAAAQRQLPAFRNLQRSASPPTALIEKTVFRGWLTLKAMEALPISEYPELAMTANFWAPVQAYYAVHAIGLGCLAALQTTMPDGHRAFCAAAAEQLVVRVPYPFNMWHRGLFSSGPDYPCEFGNSTVSVAEVTTACNLETPSQFNAAVLAAKALQTTRKKLLDQQFANMRAKKIKPGKLRRNLRREEKIKVEQNLHRTSVFDFFYRIRVRSNYDDPEMYIFGQTDTDTAQRHYQHLLKITKALAQSLENVIAQKCGAKLIEGMRAKFLQRV